MKITAPFLCTAPLLLVISVPAVASPAQPIHRVAPPKRAATAQLTSSQSRSPRSVTLLDEGWRLYTMPDFEAWPAEQKLTAEQIAQLKAPAPGAGWRSVQIPDDFVVRGEIEETPNKSLLAGGSVCQLAGRECIPPDGRPTNGHPGALNGPGRNAYAGHGYLPLYPAWYERSMFVPKAAQGRNVWLDFAGVYRDAAVFVNGQFIGQHASGYTGFRFNIASAVRYGEENNVAVFVDPRWFEGWFYEGGGIYRHVRLIVADRLQVAPWGTFVDAHVPGAIRSGTSKGQRATAQLAIQTTIRNDHPTSRGFTLISQVIDPEGKLVASTSTSEELAAGKEATFNQQANLPDALLWSPAHPNLYKLITSIRTGQSTIDRTETTFGVRTLRFDPEKGFFLNGEHVEIKGMCVHQDFPGIGVAAPDNLWPWRIRQLQAMGANAWRTAHNPLPDAFYDDADRMGMLVMDENRHLGDTYFPKASDDTPYSDLSDVEEMVRQGRNHPSIIMWSLANEEGEGAKPHGATIFAAMMKAVKALDSSRPVTGAINQGFTDQSYIPDEDILGINYHSTDFVKMHKQFPNLMIFGSEDVNAKTSRGTLESSRSTGLCSEYGCDSGLDSGPWRSWVPITENPFVAGQFVWTAFDYRGEPNPFSWPAVTSQTGIMDLAGFPKADYYYWKAAWDEKPIVYIFPEWTLPQNSIGKKILVRAYSNCDRIELFLNGKSLGAQNMTRNRYLDWNVMYAPGKLTAVGYRKGREVARYSLETGGAPTALALTAEMIRLKANGEDVAPIAVKVLDAKGRIAHEADIRIRFTVSGSGTLAGVASGNPASHEPNVSNECRAFRGLCMFLVKAADHPGAIAVEAHAQGLKSATITITASAVQ